MADSDYKLEDYVPVVKYHGIHTAKDCSFSGTTTFSGTTNLAGVSLTDLTTTGNTILGNAGTDTLAIAGATTITSTGASSLAVGRQGATTPVLKINAATASVATGIEITGAASGAGVAVAAIGGTNEGLTINAKGSGAIGIGTVSTGRVTVTPVTTIVGQLSSTNPVKLQTITDVDAQSATPTIAQILGGIIRHTSVSGGGTATVPIGTAMSAGVATVAVGATIEWLYYNDGDQTVTITPDTGHTLVGGTPAVTTGKWMRITSVNTAANVWVSFLQTLM